MLKKPLYLVVVSWLLVAPAWGKEAKTKFKSIEVTRFTKQEGVETPPELPDFLMAALSDDLKKSGVFEQTIGKGEVVDPSDAPQSVVLHGTLLEYGKGSVKKRLIPYAGAMGAGGKTLRVRITVQRRSDNQTMLEREIKERLPYEYRAEQLAKFLAKKIAKEIKNGLR